MALKQKILIGFVLITTLMLNACMVGPNYKKPCAKTPQKFKETPKNWRIARPRDNFDRGQWWKIFKDPELDCLEKKLNISNQTIATAINQYRQARDLVDEARASLFPTISMAAVITRQRQVSTSAAASTALASSSSTTTSSSSTGAATTSTSSISGTGNHATVTTFHTLLLNAQWEPDLWGSIRRTIEANEASAQSFNAQLALARLSAQASLAEYYFELHGLDRDQELLNDTVRNYKKVLQIVTNQYHAGTAAQADVVQARSSLESAEAAAINNKILRSQYEHAIAVLIGEPPSTFSLVYKPLRTTPPAIPISLPCELLERRPDVASAERLMAQANAQIGVAIAAYYPTLSLSGSASSQHTGLAHWFSVPSLNWSIGPQLAETLFDGGLRNATTGAAWANYYATVGTYRQTVLAAFQDVEDNLVAVRVLKEQSVIDNKAAADARLALKLVINQYKSGIVPFSSVITAETAAFAAEKTAADVNYLRMTSAVGLIKALGGGWNDFAIDSTAKY